MDMKQAHAYITWLKECAQVTKFVSTYKGAKGGRKTVASRSK